MKHMRFKNRHQRRGMKKMFKLEALEQRILLSADPVFGPAQLVLPHTPETSMEALRVVQQQIDAEASGHRQIQITDARRIANRNAAADEVISIDQGKLDLALLQAGEQPVGDIVVGAQGILGGSGWALELVNEGVVSPGYSPGEIVTDTFTQTADGQLEIEIAGTANNQFDRIVANDRAVLDGELTITLLDDFVPEVGDQFRFLTTPNVEGKFDSVTGVVGFEGDRYFTIEQDSEGLVLVTRELMDDNLGFGFDILPTDTQNNLGTLLNFDYLGLTGTVSFSGSLDVGLVNISGDYVFKRDASVVLNPGDGPKSYGLLGVTAQNASASLSLGGVLDVNMAGVTLDLAYLEDFSAGDSWSYLDISGASLAASSALFDITAEDYSLSLGKKTAGSGSELLDLSANQITVGDTVFANSLTSEFLYLSGDASLDFGAILLGGTTGLSIDATGFTAVGNDASALLEAGEFSVGVDQAQYGLVVENNQLSALEASGSFYAFLGDIVEASANSAHLLYNATSTDYVGTDITAGSLSYSFSQLDQSVDIFVAADNAKIGLADVISVQGNLAVRQGTQSVTLANGQSLSVEGLLFGTENAQGVFGVEGSALNITGVDFALALLSDVSSSRSWIAAKGSVGDISLPAIDGVAASFSNGAFSFSRATDGGAVVDFAATNLVIRTGVTGSITLDFDGSRGEFTQLSGDVELNLFSNLALSGGFAVTIDVQSFDLSNGESIQANTLLFGLNDADAFVGVDNNGDLTGVSLSGVDLGLIIATDSSNSLNKYLAMVGDVNGARLEGVPDITLSVSDGLVEFNKNLAEEGSQTVVPETKTATIVDLNFDNGDGLLTLALGAQSAAVTLSSNASQNTLRRRIEEAARTVATNAGFGANGSVTVTGDVENGFRLSFEGDFLGEDITALSVASSVGNASITTVQAGNIIAERTLTADANENTVLDFSNSAKSVATSTDTSILIDIDGALGAVTQIKLDAEISIAGFVDITGEVAIRQDINGVVFVGESISANLGTDTLGVSVTGAQLGIKVSQDDVVVATSGGALDASLANVACECYVRFSFC
ncbi:MAG: LEPR-XLL domain-containing protein [Alphaproteobacteria bacterium]|nr:LEPR-XLL domain-containing protein [Alphaproteobacteria bacterium]